jgi:hypothetical protein
MRKLYKPQKNEGPIEISFGRRPKWNCPVDGQESENEEDTTTLDFKLSTSESKKLGSNELTVRKRPPKPKIKKPQVFKNPLLPKAATLPPRRKIPRSNVGPNSRIDNWSDIFSPPTATQPEVGGFQPELTNRYVRRNPQMNKGMSSIQAHNNFRTPTTKSTGSYSLPDPVTDTKESASINFNNMPRHTNNKVAGLNRNNKRKYASEIMSASSWDVPSISCTDAKTKKKPIYIHLGPSAMHRGNQGTIFLKIKEKTIIQFIYYKYHKNV